MRKSISIVLGALALLALLFWTYGQQSDASTSSGSSLNQSASPTTDTVVVTRYYRDGTLYKESFRDTGGAEFQVIEYELVSQSDLDQLGLPWTEHISMVATSGIIADDIVEFRITKALSDHFQVVSSIDFIDENTVRQAELIYSSSQSPAEFRRFSPCGSYDLYYFDSTGRPRLQAQVSCS